MRSNLIGVTRLLGYLGLIPFVVPAILVAIDSPYSSLSQLIAYAYAFGIISFLTGSWWGQGLSNSKPVLLVLSNLFFLTAFFVFFMAEQWWALTATILLISIFFAEKTSSLFADLPQHYRSMRAILTLFASLSMLVIHLAR